ncbi:MAG: hypothetical protein ACO25B_00720 [Chitinophagaceae bacterium]
MKVLKNWGMTAALVLSLAVLTGCEGPIRITGGITYTNPVWGPSYHPGTRYYYIPDIEVYYDMYDQQYIYLQNGQWIFTPILPSIYAYYDLYTGFVITLNTSVYQPWLHHQYYVSHYPRYYYRNIYQNQYTNIRGFNENLRQPVYWQQGEKDRMKELRNNPLPARQPDLKRPPQNTNYYGKPLGEPVKVRPQMKKKDDKNENKLPVVRPSRKKS